MRTDGLNGRFGGGVGSNMKTKSSKLPPDDWFYCDDYRDVWIPWCARPNDAIAFTDAS